MSVKPTLDSTGKSLRRIVVFFRSADDDTKDYVRGIHEQIQHRMTAEEFDRVCIEVCARMEPFKRPVPSEYFAVQKVLRQDAHRGAATNQHEMAPEERHQWCVDHAQKLLAKGAQWVLAASQRFGVEFTPDVTAILIQRTMA